MVTDEPATGVFCFMQDPTEQTKIDNFMVQELDGTVNEWGWCKQKVYLVFFSGCLQLFVAVHFFSL